ncbi:MAG: tryptophan--tRNA ligase [Acidobacteriia bacterium]|nr:tryptophan--tRNA ligase [Terriglobia bacterium]
MAAEETKKKRVLSGMRPTGRLHIGHYFGALENWVRLQNDPGYDCFYFVADWHALTTDYADPSGVAQSTIEIATDWLAAGLDPEKAVLFVQSQVPEHAELHLLLSMVTPLGWLERVPTYKEQLDNIKDKDLHTYGFLGYPTLQTADIIIYGAEGLPLVVPVGEDQVAHVELSREIVRKFNFHFGMSIDTAEMSKPENAMAVQIMWETFRGKASAFSQVSVPSQVAIERMAGDIRKAAMEGGLVNFYERFVPWVQENRAAEKFIALKAVLTPPQEILTKTPRIPGTDGRKMSKSYGNFISLSESDADIRAKTKVMVTDPARKRRTDVGDPEKCPAYDWHKLFSSKETLEWAAAGCRTAGIGCIECKAKMADHLITWIEPVRARRKEYEAHPGRVLEILDAGSGKARKVAQGTMERVREAVFGWGRKRKEVAEKE